MSSRQGEKEQRRRERVERERAEQQAAKRKRLVQIIGAVFVGTAIVVGVVLALAGGKDEPADATDLASAGKAAGCVVRSFPNEGSAHVEKKLKATDFKTNPPTSGDHNVTPAPDGVYAPGNEPEIQNWVHTLEHGRILFMYKKGTPAARVAQLQKLFNEQSLGKPAYHSVLMRNNTDMPFAVAAVAWRHYAACSEFNDQTVAALRAFRELYVDKAPEQVP